MIELEVRHEGGDCHGRAGKGNPTNGSRSRFACIRRDLRQVNVSPDIDRWMIAFGILLYALVPFLIAQCARGWRSWMATAAIAALLVWNAQTHACQGMSCDLDFGSVFIAAAAFGAVAGTVTKAAMLLMASKKVDFSDRVLIILIGWAAVLEIFLAKIV